MNRNCSVCNSNDFTKAFQQEYASITALAALDILKSSWYVKIADLRSAILRLTLSINDYYRMFSNYENLNAAGKSQNKCSINVKEPIK